MKLNQLVLGASLFLTACGGGSGGSGNGNSGGGNSPPPPPPPASISVTVTPQTASIVTSATQQFACQVTGSTNTGCTWTASAGAVNASGLYTAPATAGTYQVVATAAADTSKKATATVTVTAPAEQVKIAIVPGAVTVTAGSTQQFACEVTGSANKACNWSMRGQGGGTISAAGFYTAPSAAGTYYIDATSAADPSKKATAAVTVTTGTATAPWVTGYYAGYFWDWLYEPEEVDMTGMTHIVLARVAPGGGTIEQEGKGVGDVIEAAGTFHNPNLSPVPGLSMEEWMIDEAHEAGVKTILMLGGDSEDGIGFNLSTADNMRAKFVKSIVDYMIEHDYDGVDIDWENRLADGCSAQDCGTEVSGEESIRRLIALIQEIRVEANGRPRYQNVPVLITFPGYTVKLGEDPEQYKVDVANMVDQYNLMSYGLGSTYAGAGWASWFTSPIYGAYWAEEPWQNPSAPVDLDNSMKAYEEAGVINARKKIGIGIGFYGTAFGLNMKDENGQEGRRPRLETENVRHYNLGEQGYEYFMLKELGYIDAGQLVFDDEAQAIYRTYPEAQYPQGFKPSMSPHNQRDGIAYVTYENGLSIQAKGNYVRNGGAAGTIIWMINYGDTGSTNTLMADVKCAFLQKGCPGPMTL
ncbi:glycosyl hydrolase family 18 protein [Allosphingosinicella vermicomposti]|uniref:glycosyl hydrolase family 18 protein n=1 Tax=Allosphingosinicella vermicomposti TaxID=614671 RepID=UPI00131A58B4|nr:glycosyl hydrolase family 18 protein [Allosphingosinicella vermicomposti]